MMTSAQQAAFDSNRGLPRAAKQPPLRADAGNAPRDPTMPF